MASQRRTSGRRNGPVFQVGYRIDGRILIDEDCTPVSVFIQRGSNNGISISNAFQCAYTIDNRKIEIVVLQLVNVSKKTYTGYRLHLGTFEMVIEIFHKQVA